LALTQDPSQQKPILSASNQDGTFANFA